MANEKEVTPENAGESIEFDNVSQDNDLDCLKEPEQPLGGMDEAVSGESGAESEPDMSVALAELKKANEELMDKYLRVQAEYQNYRKRVAKDIAGARNFAVIDTLTPFLQLFDNFSNGGACGRRDDQYRCSGAGIEYDTGSVQQSAGGSWGYQLQCGGGKV